MAISAAYSIWSMLRPKSVAAAAAAMEQALPISAWQPASAPEMLALVRITLPNSPATASASRISFSGKPRSRDM